VLWGLWLVTLIAAFSAGGQVNPYYLAALSPPIAALCGIGASAAWNVRERPLVPLLLLAVTSAATTLYAFWLLPSSDAPAWLRAAALLLGAAAIIAVTLAITRPQSLPVPAALMTVLFAAALVPTVASLTLVADAVGRPALLSSYGRSMLVRCRARPERPM
jgi:hypothetical protein